MVLNDGESPDRVHERFQLLGITIEIEYLFLVNQNSKYVYVLRRRNRFNCSRIVTAYMICQVELEPCKMRLSIIVENKSHSKLVSLEH